MHEGQKFSVVCCQHGEVDTDRLSQWMERWTQTDCHDGWRGGHRQVDGKVLEDLRLLHMLLEGALTISKYKTVLAAEASNKPSPFHSSVCHSRLAWS